MFNKITPIYLVSFILLAFIQCKETGKKQIIENPDPTSAKADQTVYYGGDIITMAGDSPSYVEAVVQREGKIIFTGSKEEALSRFEGKADEVDLKGKTMLPGFIDGHAHFGAFSAQAIGAQILPPPDAGAHNIAALIDILKEWNTPENRALTGWIFGAGFDDSVLEEKRFPTKHDLDKVTTEFPIMIIHISGHFAAVNSKGLEQLNITAETKNPEGGLIRRENGNEPNGVLEELAAIPYYARALTPKTVEAAELFFESGQNMALSYGYTTAQEGRAMLENHALLSGKAKESKLKLDVVSYVDYMFVDSLMATKWNSKKYTNGYRIGGMKLTLDGSPQGRTAWRTQPYLLLPDGAKDGYLGYPAIPKDSDVEAIYKKGFENDWQILTHANGDAAMDQMIRTMSKVSKEYEKEIRMYYGRWEEMLHGEIKPTRLILNELKSLHKVKLYALTNWSAETFPIAQNRFKFLNYFEGIVVSGDEKVRKPFKKIYEILLNRFDLKPQHCVFIDDSKDNVEGAEKAGIKGIHYKNSEQLRNELQLFRLLP